jgi:spectinomycin phosphotransferase
MTEKQHLTDQCIIDCLNTDYGIEATTLSSLSLGADMDASVHRAQALDGTSYFVKLKRGHFHSVGITLLSLLQMAGLQHIIPPVKTIHGKPILHIKDYTLIVYPFIEGRNAFSHTMTNDQWITLGKVLRQIHEFALPQSVHDKISREMYSPKWRKAVRTMYSHFRTKHYSDEIALKLVAFMKEHDAEIYRLMDRAERLSEVLCHQTHKLVLCHSDIHGGNVLIDKSGVIYIVDWDEPIMAPKERDLMFIGGGVANVWNKLNEEDFFYKGYGKTEINKTILAYYRHERILEDIAHYCQLLLLTMSGGNDRKVMYKQFKDMFEPLGVVDIAFKTDDGLNQ